MAAVALEPAQEVTTTIKLHTKQRRVVVTGMGVVTPLGHDPNVFYNNLLDGVSGISEIETFDCAEFPTVNHILFNFLYFPSCWLLLQILFSFSVFSISSRGLLVKLSLFQLMAG